MFLFIHSASSTNETADNTCDRLLGNYYPPLLRYLQLPEGGSGMSVEDLLHYLSLVVGS